MKHINVDYSDIAEYYDKVRITSPKYLKFWVARIAHYGSIDKSSKVLDIGCGTGRFSIIVAKSTGAKIYAIDPSEEMLAKARRKDKKNMISWRKGTAEELPFQDEYFDCVYMTFVFHQIKNRKKAISEMFRVLKPKGKCVIMTTSYAHIRRSPLYLFPKLAAIDLGRFPSLPEFRRILKKGGFRNVHYHLDKHEDKRYLIDDYLNRVKRKHISTLSILSDKDFKNGYKIFEKRMRKKFKDYLVIPHGVCIVSGEK